jgi:NAD-dependent deacetylase
MDDNGLEILAHRLLNTSRTLIITGAGISAESGISTFRGTGGYWNRYKAEELASPQGFARDPELVWQWYNDRREILRKASSNAAHQALPLLARTLKETTLVTQNVDGLHGEDIRDFEDYVEIHGNIWRVKCTHSGKAWFHRQAFTVLPPRCACGKLLRPDVLWFGETYAQDAMQRALKAARKAENVLVIGTSGLVWIVAGLLEQAMPEAYTAEFNLEATALSDVVDISFLGNATLTLPALVQHLQALKNC